MNVSFFFLLIDSLIIDNLFFHTLRIPCNISESYYISDITTFSSDFYGQALHIGKGFFFQFTCKLFQIPVDNSLTFLVNEKTVDILRFEKLDCYNIKGKCTENSCSCSLSTNTFQWFYSISTSLKKMIFEVQARYADMSTGKIVKVSLSRTFYSEGMHHMFYLYQY